MAGITKNILVGVTTIVLGGVAGDYVAKPLVEAAKPWIVALLGQIARPPAKPNVSPPLVPQPPPAKLQPIPQPKRAAPVAAPQPFQRVTRPERLAPVAEPKFPPAGSPPLPKASAPVSKAPPPARPTKSRPAPRLVPPPPAPRPQEWAESPGAYAGGSERRDEFWPEQESPELEWQLARDEERRAPPPEPSPDAVPPDGWPVNCGFERPCSQRRPRKPEWRLW